jgi:hypothetical protein
MYPNCKGGDNIMEAIRRIGECATLATEKAEKQRHQHRNFLLSPNSPSRTPNAGSRETLTRTQVTTTPLSWSHVFLRASVKHSLRFSRTCDTLMQPQEAITAVTVCLSVDNFPPTLPKRISCTPHLTWAYSCCSHAGKITSHQQF